MTKPRQTIPEYMAEHVPGQQSHTFKIPKDPTFGPRDAQCKRCGGHGCSYCAGQGWVDFNSPAARLCEHPTCRNRIRPAQLAVYCSTECAVEDA